MPFRRRRVPTLSQSMVNGALQMDWRTLSRSGEFIVSDVSPYIDPLLEFLLFV